MINLIILVNHVGGGGGSRGGGGGMGYGGRDSMDRGRRSPMGMRNDSGEITSVFVRNVSGMSKYDIFLLFSQSQLFNSWVSVDCVYLYLTLIVALLPCSLVIHICCYCLIMSYWY